MNVSLKNVKLQYKAPDGGATRRIPEHFAKRNVMFEVNGEERRIFISKDELPREATEEEIVRYIQDNFEDSSVTNEQLKRLEQEDLNNKQAIAEMYMMMLGGNLS